MEKLDKRSMLIVLGFMLGFLRKKKNAGDPHTDVFPKGIKMKNYTTPEEEKDVVKNRKLN